MYAMPGYSSLFALTCAVKRVGAGEKKGQTQQMKKDHKKLFVYLKLGYFAYCLIYKI